MRRSPSGQARPCSGTSDWYSVFVDESSSELEVLRAVLAAGEGSGPSAEFDFQRRIEELTAQAADAGLIDDFLAGRLVRSSEPTDTSELPVPGRPPQ
ncbi:type II toxin-antitoxin system ParD family antitoxin [Nocardia flavorosea]|uniref:type II toxin-antitoxin system ParD family antitoxin n=1 Tax=Nocardia flavorosea TaxID=53429 RepID=UPI0035316243